MAAQFDWQVSGNEFRGLAGRTRPYPGNQRFDLASRQPTINLHAGRQFKSAGAPFSWHRSVQLRQAGWRRHPVGHAALDDRGRSYLHLLVCAAHNGAYGVHAVQGSQGLAAMKAMARSMFLVSAPPSRTTAASRPFPSDVRYHRAAVRLSAMTNRPFSNM